MRLSKSRFMELHRCNKAGWLSIHRPELTEVDEKTDELLKEGNEIGELARSILGEYKLVEVVPDKMKMINDTIKFIEEGTKIIAEASFSFDGCFCSVDMVEILNKDKKEINVYEVKNSCEVKPEHLIDMAYQYYVLTGLGFNIKHFNHVHINSNYYRMGDLDLKQLFVIIDCIPDILLNLKEITDNIRNYKDILDSECEPKIEIGCQCRRNNSNCEYFDYCTAHLGKPNIFDVSGKGLTFKAKIELYSHGIITYEDVLSRKPNLNQMRMNEIECEVKKKDMPYKINEVKSFLEKFKYPLNFLDFETYQNPVPEFDDEKPFIQIPFQYSLHVLSEDGTLEHKEFIAPVGSNARMEITKKLISDLSQNEGSIIAYNASFEKMVIKDCAELFPLQYCQIMNFRKRFIDLMDPFSKQWIYLNAFKGSYSIKYVLPALFPDDEELNYHNLDTIQNGSIAMKVYQKMREYDKETQDKMFERLYKYCCLDTYAMVKIFWWLKDLCCV